MEMLSFKENSKSDLLTASKICFLLLFLNRNKTLIFWTPLRKEVLEKFLLVQNINLDINLGKYLIKAIFWGFEDNYIFSIL